MITDPSEEDNQERSNRHNGSNCRSCVDVRSAALRLFNGTQNFSKNLFNEYDPTRPRYLITEPGVGYRLKTE